MDNPKAARDIIENPDAVYGFSPNPESTRIGKYADKIDWTNPEQVAVARQTREAYHNVNESLLQDLYNSGYTTKDIAAKFGMSLEQALEKYGSHEEIINATVRSNPGMDACTVMPTLLVLQCSGLLCNDRAYILILLSLLCGGFNACGCNKNRCR